MSFLFILYFVFFCWLITKIKFFKQAGLSNTVLTGLFLVKIIAGLAYAFYFLQPSQIEGSDTWRYYRISLSETNMLLTHPVHFVTSLFQYHYDDAGNLFNAHNSYWNDLKSNTIIKLIAVINVFTNRNYYADIVFFNFFFFFGLMAFYRLMNTFFIGKKWLLIVSVFLTPSFLFWCSGIHKDGLIFSALGLILYFFYLSLQKGFSFKRVVIIVLSALLIFALRNHVCIILIPALTGWWLVQKFNLKPIVVFASVYSISVILFFASPYIHPKINLPQYVVTKQQEFNHLKGNSKINAEPLFTASFNGFMHYLPTALDMSFLRPHFFEIQNKAYWPAIAEIYGLLILSVLILFFKRKNIPPSLVTILWVNFSIAFSLLLIEG